MNYKNPLEIREGFYLEAIGELHLNHGHLINIILWNKKKIPGKPLLVN
jgi:hypothetical protein